MGRRIEVTMLAERETKNTVRFEEVVSDGQEPAVGTIYVPKRTLRELGADGDLVVTIEPAK